jgi:hypothetical protein
VACEGNGVPNGIRTGDVGARIAHIVDQNVVGQAVDAGTVNAKGTKWEPSAIAQVGVFESAVAVIKTIVVVDD